MIEFDRYPILGKSLNQLNLEILESALITGDASWHHEDIVSPFNRIYFIISGDAYLKDTAGIYPLRPGYMYLIPANSKYTYVCTDEFHMFYIHFNIALFPGIDLFSRFPHFLENRYIPDLLGTLLLDAKKESVVGLLSLKAALWQILFDFYRMGDAHTDYMDQFQGFHRQKTVLDYLSAHLTATLRITDLAAALNTPVHLLSRSFQQDTGHGLKEYMEQLLLQKARHLLLHTSMPVNQIAESLGFSDPFYFSRFFKKAERLSPREYRKQRF